MKPIMPTPITIRRGYIPSAQTFDDLTDYWARLPYRTIEALERAQAAQRASNDKQSKAKTLP